MNDYLPSFVFTDQVPAQQLVRLSELNDARQNAEQLRAMAAVKNYQDAQNARDLRDMQQQQLQQNYAVQMGQLNQRDRQFDTEAALRRELQQGQIQGQKDLLGQQLDFYRANPYFGKNNSDLILGATQMNQAIQGSNDEADVESSALNQQLQALNQQHDIKVRSTRDHNALSRNVFRGRGIWHDTTNEQVAQADADYASEVAKLAGLAKKSVLVGGKFVPKTRQPITMGNMNGAAATQPSPFIPAPASQAETNAPASSGLDAAMQLKSQFQSGQMTPAQYAAALQSMIGAPPSNQLETPNMSQVEGWKRMYGF